VSATRSYPKLRRFPLASTFDVPTPPDELLPDTYAARLYAMLAPLAQHDDDADWSLLILVNAIATPFQLVEDLVRDTSDGPGWSMLLDLERCPPEALPWLAQFVGVRLIDAPADEQRARIASTDGWKRGTPAALRGAVEATLTGGRNVVFRERYHEPPVGDPDGAYYLQVITYANETPDPDATLEALLAQKPGGIVLDYHTVTGQDYQIVKDDWASYAAARTGYASYSAMLLDTPATP
jgi:hypothetical protein